ncbi:MAG: FAD-binding oxidoreductase [Flaviaesturariibacter sp.]|nr:FAD-binding oxidoreductase [Flaviaesturariibacter sp.]
MMSIWEAETFFAPQDVVIAGSGFVGLWSAFHLKRKHPKAKITIIDRGIIPTGASTRNAGFACFGSLSELMRDAQTMGTDKMLSILAMRYKGLQSIQKYFKKSAIDFEMCGGYELYGDKHLATETLHSNIDYINALLKPVTDTKLTFKLTDGKIAAFRFGNTRHLVKNNLEGYLHSGKLVKALLQEVQTMGVQVLTGIEIKSYSDQNGSLELITDKSFTLSTAQLLICTNAFAKDLVPELDIVPARGQVVLTSPIKNLPIKGTFHSEEGYYYFRNLGDRVLLGGARHMAFEEEQTHTMETSETIQAHLQSYLNEVVLPNHKGQYHIERKWSGIMAMGAEKTPIVKQLAPNVFCAVRMNGMGVALAPIVAQDIAKQML